MLIECEEILVESRSTPSCHTVINNGAQTVIGVVSSFKCSSYLFLLGPSEFTFVKNEVFSYYLIKQFTRI